MTHEITNRKANDFDISETLEAGIILVGREIKSVAKKEVDLTGARCVLRNDLLLVNAFIKKEVEDYFSVPFEPNRDRVLLVRKSELRFLRERLKKGFYAIPIKMYLKKSKYKVMIGVGKPVLKGDKRQKEIDKQVRKEMYD